MASKRRNEKKEEKLLLFYTTVGLVRNSTLSRRLIVWLGSNWWLLPPKVACKEHWSGLFIAPRHQFSVTYYIGCERGGDGSV